jgi:hypothetical protein
MWAMKIYRAEVTTLSFSAQLKQKPLRVRDEAALAWVNFWINSPADCFPDYSPGVNIV